jgi:ABC-type branched-subunit amino acid transport system ATPase component/ABC-type branched-subunit amino acid transport system permease subunit
MKNRIWIPIFVIALLAAVMAPFWLSTFPMTILTSALVFAIFAVSLNLILGHGGMPSLGHAVFLGIGSYTVGFMVHHWQSSFLLTALAAVAVSSLAAAAIGPVVLRTRGTYFLMVTLAIGEVLRNISISWRSLTGGDDGLTGINAGIVAGIDFGQSRNFYFLVLGSLLIVLALMWMLTNAPFGHALRAIRDNRSRLSILGVHPMKVEVTAFVISAGLAGYAGFLLAYEKAFVSPSVFSVETSAQALLMVVVGGAGTLFGPVVGALAVEFIRGIGSVYTDRWQTVLGLLAVLVAINSRQMLVQGLLSVIAGKIWGKSAEVATAPVAPIAPALAPSETKEVQPASLHSAPPIVHRVPSVRKNGSIIKASNIAKRFGGLSVLRDISLSVAPGERMGLIGPNGAGKTTFLNILSGIEVPTAGAVSYGGKDVTSMPSYRRAQLGVGRTFQIGNLFNDCTVRENIALALVARESYGLRFGRSLSQYADLQHEAVDLLDKWKLREIEDIPVKLLSYGQRRVVEIVLALATRPQLLLLDEPAAGLSGTETKMIIETISALDPALSILIVEHDMDLIFSVCDRVTVIAGGEVLAEGVGDEVRRDKRVIDAYLGMPL